LDHISGTRRDLVARDAQANFTDAMDAAAHAVGEVRIDFGEYGLRDDPDLPLDDVAGEPEDMTAHTRARLTPWGLMDACAVLEG
jgi:hypothetical protein